MRRSHFQLVLFVCILLVVAKVSYSRGQASVEEPVLAPEQMLTVEAHEWDLELLSRLGNQQPEAITIIWLQSWIQSEGAAAECYNPLNTSQDAANVTRVVNSHKVKCYGDYETGLNATVETLVQNYPGYAEIVAGLQNNDVERAQAGLVASPWGTHAGLVAQVFSEKISAAIIVQEEPDPVASEQAPAQIGKGQQFASNSMPLLGGDCGFNELEVLKLAPDILLKPGESWSLNQTMGVPYVDIEVRDCGPPGGGWCNTAALIAQVSRNVGLQPQFIDHGLGDIGGGPENSVMIWNKGGYAGSGDGAGDLELTNTTNNTIHIWGHTDGNSITYYGEIL